MIARHSLALTINATSSDHNPALFLLYGVILLLLFVALPAIWGVRRRKALHTRLLAVSKREPLEIKAAMGFASLVRQFRLVKASWFALILVPYFLLSSIRCTPSDSVDEDTKAELVYSISYGMFLFAILLFFAIVFVTVRWIYYWIAPAHSGTLILDKNRLILQSSTQHTEIDLNHEWHMEAVHYSRPINAFSTNQHWMYNISPDNGTTAVRVTQEDRQICFNYRPPFYLEIMAEHQHHRPNQPNPTGALTGPEGYVLHERLHAMRGTLVRPAYYTALTLK